MLADGIRGQVGFRGGGPGQARLLLALQYFDGSENNQWVPIEPSNVRTTSDINAVCSLIISYTYKVN